MAHRLCALVSFAANKVWLDCDCKLLASNSPSKQSLRIGTLACKTCKGGPTLTRIDKKSLRWNCELRLLWCWKAKELCEPAVSVGVCRCLSVFQIRSHLLSHGELRVLPQKGRKSFTLANSRTWQHSTAAFGTRRVRRVRRALIWDLNEISMSLRFWMILSWDAGLRISAGCFCSSSSGHRIKQNPHVDFFDLGQSFMSFLYAESQQSRGGITWKSFCRNIGYSPRNLPLALKPAGMLNQTTWDSLADRIRFGYSSVIELLGGKTTEGGISGDTDTEASKKFHGEIHGFIVIASHRQSSPHSPWARST